MTMNDNFELSCVDYVKRRQIAIDHGQNATHVDLEPMPTRREVALPSIAYQLALSQDELHLAVAYGDHLAVYEVAEIYQSVWQRLYVLDLVAQSLCHHRLTFVF